MQPFNYTIKKQYVRKRKTFSFPSDEEYKHINILAHYQRSKVTHTIYSQLTLATLKIARTHMFYDIIRVILVLQNPSLKRSRSLVLGNELKTFRDFNVSNRLDKTEAFAERAFFNFHLMEFASRR